MVAWVPCHDGTCSDTTAPARANLSPEEKAAAGKLELVEADWPDRYSRSALRARTPRTPRTPRALAPVQCRPMEILSQNTLTPRLQ